MIIRLVNANLGKADNIETDVETWGELQTLDEVQGFMSGDTKAVVRETRNTLESDQAELPNEKLTDESKDYDYTLFFITKKSKAGADYESMSFSQLRRECANRDDVDAVSPGNYGSYEDMIQKLRESDQSSGVCEADAGQLDRIEDKLDRVLDAVSSDTAQDQLDSGPTAEEEDEFRSIADELG